jgi:hypothetical protein
MCRQVGGEGEGVFVDGKQVIKKLSIVKAT